MRCLAFALVAACAEPVTLEPSCAIAIDATPPNGVGYTVTVDCVGRAALLWSAQWAWGVAVNQNDDACGQVAWLWFSGAPTFRAQLQPYVGTPVNCEEIR